MTKWVEIVLHCSMLAMGMYKLFKIWGGGQKHCWPPQTKIWGGQCPSFLQAADPMLYCTSDWRNLASISSELLDRSARLTPLIYIQSIFCDCSWNACLAKNMRNFSMVLTLLKCHWRCRAPGQSCWNQNRVANWATLQ